MSDERLHVGRFGALDIRSVGFDELTSIEAYRLWQLRQQVFIVEQASPYADLDGRDLEPTTIHLLAEADSFLLGCARVLSEFDVRRIGRVVVASTARGHGIAAKLVEAALAVCGEAEVRLDAQTYLADWYATYGFEVSGEEFDEDGILHVPMRRPAAGE